MFVWFGGDGFCVGWCWVGVWFGMLSRLSLELDALMGLGVWLVCCGS